MSNLDFTGVIEEHNEVHHRQRLMELPVLEFYLKKRAFPTSPSSVAES